MKEDKASMSSVWKDGRTEVKPHDVFKSKRWNANFGWKKFGELTCVHTLMDTEGGWWKVDFEDDILVTKIAILNRNDCCEDRLKGAKVFVGDHQFGTIHDQKRGDWSKLKNRVEGKFLKVQG